MIDQLLPRGLDATGLTALTADLVCYSLQVGLLVTIGGLLPRILRLDHPRLSLFYWQSLLAGILLLPFMQLGSQARLATGNIAVSSQLWIAEITATAKQSVPGLQLEIWLWGLLAIGAGVRLLRTLLGLHALKVLRRDAKPLLPLPSTVLELESRLGRQVEWRVSPGISTPVTFGWRRPSVLLPTDFITSIPARQRAIACHELLHVRRRDWLAVLAEETIRALLWFHPGVWLLLTRIELSREQVIDRDVVRLTENRRAYLETLHDAAERLRLRAPAPGLPIFNRSHLLARVLLLTKEVSMSKLRLTATVATLCGLLALTALLGMAAFPLTAEVPAGEEIYRVGEDVTPPKKIHAPIPAYPPEARKEGRKGKVVAETIIDRKGDVRDVKIVESIGESFDRSVIEAVSTWKFEPATLDGKPVTVRYYLTINFRLD